MTRIERRNAIRANRMRVSILSCVVLLILVAVLLAFQAAEPDAETPKSTEMPELMTLVEISPPDKPDAFRPAQEAGAAETIARMLWGEARGCSPTEQAAVVWCALNRVDSEDPYYPDDIVSVVTQDLQFHGYDPDNPVIPEILALVEDVLARWSIEDGCVGGVGRVLPREYLFFTGDGTHNYFRTDWTGGETWAWGLESPYEEG
ncbi:MAG: hypothetical protein RR336_00195 [Oscillospiraceae bacterium]